MSHLHVSVCSNAACDGTFFLFCMLNKQKIIGKSEENTGIYVAKLFRNEHTFHLLPSIKYFLRSATWTDRQNFASLLDITIIAVVVYVYVYILDV